MLFYILDEADHPKQVTQKEWGLWFNTADTIVADTQVGESKIGTVFKSCVMGETALANPHVWETKVYGGPLHGDTTSCGGTRAHALTMHDEMVARVQAVLNQQRTN